MSVHPFGLLNTGVICYFNALIQSIISYKSIVKYYSDMRASTRLGFVFRSFLDKIKMENYKDIEKYSGSILKQLLYTLSKEKIYADFGHGQEDSFEAFNYLIDMLEKDAHFKGIKQYFTTKVRVDIKCIRCGYIKINMENGTNLFVHPKNMSLDEMDLSKCNEIVDDYKCPSCNQLGQSNIFRKLVSAPSNLVLVLNSRYSKPTSFHNIPNNRVYLTLLDHKYKLVSQIRHIGTHNSGHYYATSLRGHKYYTINDTHIRLSDAKIAKNATLLFYELII